jgi:hypothetical protein
MIHKLKPLMFAALPVAALFSGCRCENLGGSECGSANRCRTIFMWEADPVRGCRGDKRFLRCERDEGGQPQLDNHKLVRDADGRYWLADPEELPGAKVEDAGAASWPYCSSADTPREDAAAAHEEVSGG